jgi:GNAT superfamily N-acetyltransferase
VVTRGTEADVGDLQEFQARMFGERSRQQDPARTAWLFFERAADEPPSVWIVRDAGRVVGMSASIGFELEAGGVTRPARYGVDLRVDPAHRGDGIASALIDERLRSEGMLVGFGLSHGGVKLMERMGAIGLGQVPRYVFTLTAEAVASQVSARWRRVVRVGVAAPVAVLRGMAGLRARGVELVATQRFDARADALWHDVASNYTVIARRDAAWLRWRFDGSPYRDEYLRYFARRGGRVVAYVVLRPKVWHGEPTLEIIDYLAAPRLVPALFGAVVHLARERQDTLVACVTRNGPARGRVRRMGFVRRGGERLVVTTRLRGPVIDLVKDADAWFVTAGDSDMDPALREGNSESAV